MGCEPRLRHHLTGLVALARKQSGGISRAPKMLLLRGARAASAWAASTAGASGGRSISIRLTPVAALSSGGRKRKGQRRGEAKPPSPPPPPPLPRQGETPSSKKKSGARPSGEDKRRPVELEEARGPRRPPEGGEARKGNTQQQQQQQLEKAKAKRLVRWKCASGCGACCKLDKGPDFPTPDEIFADHPDDLQLYRSMIGTDGWCINYDKATRTCNIYQDRPSFCRVEPKVFDDFFGVPRSRFDREACSACVDNIKMVYGDDSAELKNFKRVIREESNKLESKSQDKLLDA